DPMVQEPKPEHLADAHRSASEDRELAIQILAPNPTHALHRFPMDALVPRFQLGDGAGPLHAGRLLSVEIPLHGDGGHDRLELGEVPGELAEGAAIGIGAEVILIFGQGLEEFRCESGLDLPQAQELLDLVAKHAANPPVRANLLPPRAAPEGGGPGIVPCYSARDGGVCRRSVRRGSRLHTLGGTMAANFVSRAASRLAIPLAVRPAFALLVLAPLAVAPTPSRSAEETPTQAPHATAETAAPVAG